MSRPPVLEVSNLTVGCATSKDAIRPVDGVSLSVEAGEIVGIIGESGCGKSTLVRTLIGLTARNCRVIGGEVRFRGETILDATTDLTAQVRGERIGMIFQNATSSLNPVFTIGTQIDEVLRVHRRGLAKRVRREVAEGLLGRLGFTDADAVLSAYPHQLSGGMRQRAAIALATCLEPAVLLADESTTALDVTTQAEVVDLLRQLVAGFDTALVFVTHDLALAAEICERVLVMYAGQIVEAGRVDRLLATPDHPYTRALLDAIPGWDDIHDLSGIAGRPPVVSGSLVGCRFADRCGDALPECRNADASRWVTTGSDSGHRCVRGPGAPLDSSAAARDDHESEEKEQIR